MADTNGADSSRAAVYVAWGTFKNALEEFVEHPLNRVDRTVFPNLAGGVLSQLFAGLKFLGLTTDDGRTTPLFHELAVPDEATRKAKLGAILRDKYAALFQLDLTKTTLGELSEQMEKSYSVSGSSRRKAIRFFLAATTYTGVSLSPHLKSKSRGSDGGTPTVRKRRTGRVVREPEASPRTPPPQTASNSRVVTLKSGGTLTLIASVDFLTIDAEDRAFVFRMIDELKQYENKSSPA